MLSCQASKQGKILVAKKCRKVRVFLAVRMHTRMYVHTSTPYRRRSRKTLGRQNGRFGVGNGRFEIQNGRFGLRNGCFGLRRDHFGLRNDRFGLETYVSESARPSWTLKRTFRTPKWLCRTRFSYFRICQRRAEQRVDDFKEISIIYFGISSNTAMKDNDLSNLDTVLGILLYTKPRVPRRNC